MALTDEDLLELERSGRRCGICRSGRRWREFEVVRREGREPVVMCPACRARHGQAPPAHPAREQSPAVQPKVAATAHRPQQRNGRPQQRNVRPEQRSDRLKRALAELPRGEYATGRIAKAAGLNHDKTLLRLKQLQEAGEIRQIGNRWSTKPAPSDLEGAFDRLQARTSNLRIVRDRTPAA